MLAFVDYMSGRIVRIPDPIAQSDEDLLWRGADILDQDSTLFQLLVQGLAIIGIPVEGPCANEEIAVLGVGSAHLDAKHIRLPRVAILYAKAQKLLRVYCQCSAFVVGIARMSEDCACSFRLVPNPIQLFMNTGFW